MDEITLKRGLILTGDLFNEVGQKRVLCHPFGRM